MDDKQLQKLVKSPKVVFYEEAADNIFHIYLREVGDVMEIPHYHNSFEFLCVVDGEIDVHIGEETRRLTAGEIVCVTSLQIHYYNRLAGFKGISLVVSEEYLRSFMKIYPDLFFPTFLLKSEENLSLMAFLQNWAEKIDRTLLSDCGYVNLFLDKMQRIYQLQPIKKNDSNNIIIKFIRYVNEHYMENISLESMAKAFSYSVGRCSTLFNEGIGMSFKRYLNCVRMQAMKTLLKEKKYTNMEIMEMCGYNSPVTFYRHYKILKEKK